MATGVELLLEQGQVDVLPGGDLQQFLGALEVVFLGAAEVEFDPVEDLTVELRLGGEQFVVVGLNLGQLFREGLEGIAAGLSGQGDIDEKQHLVRVLDGQ